MWDDLLVADHLQDVAHGLRKLAERDHAFVISQAQVKSDTLRHVFGQLSQTVRYVLKVIGYKEIIPHFAPSPPPISISLFEIAEEAGTGYELAFFDLLEKRINALIKTGTDNLQLCSLR